MMRKLIALCLLALFAIAGPALAQDVPVIGADESPAVDSSLVEIESGHGFGFYLSPGFENDSKLLIDPGSMTEAYIEYAVAVVSSPEVQEHILPGTLSALRFYAQDQTDNGLVQISLYAIRISVQFPNTTFRSDVEVLQMLGNGTNAILSGSNGITAGYSYGNWRKLDGEEYTFMLVFYADVSSDLLLIIQIEAPSAMWDSQPELLMEMGLSFHLTGDTDNTPFVSWQEAAAPALEPVPEAATQQPEAESTVEPDAEATDAAP